MSSDQPSNSIASWWSPPIGWPGYQSEQKPTSACAIENSVEAWRAELARPAFVDEDKERSVADARKLLDEAVAEGFTDFVLIGMTRGGSRDPSDYFVRVFSRPRTKPVLMHIVSTADQYVTMNLEGSPS